MARISKTAARRAKISLVSTLQGRKRVYVQLWDLSSNSRFHAQIWKFWESARISKKAARRAKTMSISIPWGIKRVICATFINFYQWPSLMPKYGTFENRSVSRKPLHVKRKRSSISTCLTREHMCNFTNNLYASFSLLYQNCGMQILNICLQILVSRFKYG